MTDHKKTKQTRAISAEIGSDIPFKAVAPPLYMTSTYNWPGFEQKGPFDYGRTVNPNRTGLAQALSDLEGGAGGVITASGMAAIDLVFNLFDSSALIIAPHDCYGGTHRLLTHRAKQGRMQVEFVDMGDSKALKKALKRKPALVLVETPSNPLMRIVDITKISKAAHAAGALVMCDNTFLSPARMQPLALGCDFVIHSTTKYINGHSDVVGGVAIAKSAEHAEQLGWWANCIGVTGSPFEPAVKAFVENLTLFQLAASLGGTESLICHPATMTHRGMTDDAMEIAGIKQTLIRISVGMEHIDDQIADIEAAFTRI